MLTLEQHVPGALYRTVPEESLNVLMLTISITRGAARQFPYATASGVTLEHKPWRRGETFGECIIALPNKNYEMMWVPGC